MPNPTQGFGLKFYRDRRGGSAPELKNPVMADSVTFVRGQIVLSTTTGQVTPITGAQGDGAALNTVVGIANQSITSQANNVARISVVIAEFALFACRFDDAFTNATEEIALNRIGKGFNFAAVGVEGDAADSDTLGGSTSVLLETTEEADPTTDPSWLQLVDYLRAPDNDILLAGAVGIFQFPPARMAAAGTSASTAAVSG